MFKTYVVYTGFAWYVMVWILTVIFYDSTIKLMDDPITSEENRSHSLFLSAVIFVSVLTISNLIGLGYLVWWYEKKRKIDRENDMYEGKFWTYLVLFVYVFFSAIPLLSNWYYLLIHREDFGRSSSYVATVIPHISCLLPLFYLPFELEIPNDEANSADTNTDADVDADVDADADSDVDVDSDAYIIWSCRWVPGILWVMIGGIMIYWITILRANKMLDPDTTFTGWHDFDASDTGTKLYFYALIPAILFTNFIEFASYVVLYSQQSSGVSNSHSVIIFVIYHCVYWVGGLITYAHLLKYELMQWEYTKGSLLSMGIVQGLMLIGTLSIPFTRSLKVNVEHFY